MFPDADKAEAFETKLAHLNPEPERLPRRFWDAVLHCCWWCCCCFWFAFDPYKRDSNTWAVTNADDHVARPAHLKISTSDKRAVGMHCTTGVTHIPQLYRVPHRRHYASFCAEIKIVYAVNPAVASQLYEVDVFMFFLQDLEAVSNNFYHDLWQVVRLHTPKVRRGALPARTSHSSSMPTSCTCKQKALMLQVPLSAVANDPSAGFIALIEQELLVCEKQH